MRLIFFLLSVLILNSCGQRAWTKRGERNGWIKHEIVIDTVVTSEVKKDTVFKFVEVHDTLVIKEDKLTIKYFYNNKDSTVYLYGKCDPDTIRVERQITTIETKQGINNMILTLIIILLVIILLHRIFR